MDIAKTDRFIADAWDGDIVPRLVEYIRIPNKSPMFDAQWKEHGHMDEAVALQAKMPKPIGRPYPVKGADELYGELLLQGGRPAEAVRWFREDPARQTINAEADALFDRVIAAWKAR